ncbi:intermembrane phospholipid transport protein YdbH family protein [Sphingomonas mesophila]|uniref:intermembrane phospholipid transport protein YdbH family protein n=1 Tax=Sphingomonas mesophila TaxID=2303576 RepID=UPI000E57F602|nr:YdbH domain-containing protein [Sphingomonas mesophila]
MDSGRDERALGDDAPATTEVTATRRSRLRFVSSLILVGLLVLLVGAWLSRGPIAEHFIKRELDQRGVRATYTVERIGLHNQIIRDVTIGDPARPDLTARYARIQMRFNWDGSVSVYRIVARGVRLRGRLLNSGRVTWGEVDKLLPPPSGKPFSLPDVAVDIADSTLALATPYGRLGFAVAGSGNLTGGFKGRLSAASGPLKMGACALEGMRASVALAVVARRPQVRGPVSARSVACPNSRMALVAPRLDLDSSFSEGFDQFDGRGRLAVQTLTAGDNGLANLAGTLGFKGDVKDASGRFDLSAQRARLAAIFADRTRLAGNYRLLPAKGTLAVTADYDANSAALAAPLVARLAGPFDGAKGTPMAPIASQIATSIRRTAARFDASGELTLVNGRGGGGVRIRSADARGPGGARVLVGGGDGITYYWPSGRMRVDGRIATGGGGLPRADIALRQPRGGGPLSGEARIQPLTAGGARLALAPVRFDGQADGSTELETVAILDGPIPGGRVTGLRFPIEGRLGGPGGGFLIGRGCIDARFTSLTAGGLRLGAASIPLCPTRGAIIAKRGSAPVQIGASTRNLRLAGRLGRSPFALTAAQAVLSAADRFTARELAIRMGKSEAPVRVTAARLDGNLGGGRVTGNFGGAAAIIGRVPIRLSEAAGRWTFRRGALAIDGAATVTDMAAEPRFYPLRSTDLAFRLANDRIDAGGTLTDPESGTRVANVAIDHRLSTGSGEAVIDVPGIRFALGGLQPTDLTRLTQGIVALVDGSVSGQGRIAWNGSGGVTSTGEFTTQNMNLAAAFGPVTGLSTTIRFTDLLKLETAPGQIATVAGLNPGIEVLGGEIRYQLLPGRLVRVERGEWPFMGGRLILEETILNFNKATAKRLTFTVVGLNAETFVDSLQFRDLKASGIFDGVLPMIFDEDGGRIVGGRLESRLGGGTLSYEGAINRANLGLMGGIAFDALRSLRFSRMVIRLDGDLAGEFAAGLTIDEVGLANATGTQRLVKSLVRKIPFKFNVTIRGPFRALIATAKSIRDPRNVIREVLPAPIDQIPGVITEVRRKEQTSEQTQTPVDQKIDVTTKPPAESEQRP